MTQMLLIFLVIIVTANLIFSDTPISMMILMNMFTLSTFCLMIKIISFWLLSLFVLLLLSGTSIMILYMSSFNFSLSYYNNHFLPISFPLISSFIMFSIMVFQENFQYHLASQLFNKLWISILFILILYLFLAMTGIMKSLEVFKGSLRVKTLINS